MNITRRLHLIGSLAAVLLPAALASNLVSTAAIAQDKPRILLGTQPYPGEANIFVAQAKGLFDEAGIEVITRRLPSGRLTQDAMQSGALDIATPVETGPMFAISNGTQLAILAQISTNPDEVKPIVRVDSGVKGPADLKGKRLGYGAGSSNQYAMYNWLKAGGVASSDATLVNLQPPDLVSSLINKDLDVAFVWEPFLTQAVKKGGGEIVTVEGQNLYQSRLLLVAKPQWVEGNTDTIARLLGALVKAGQWIRDNRAEAVQITAQEIGMEPNDLDPIFDRWQFDVELPKGLIDAFEAQFSWASEAGLLQQGVQKPDFSKSIYPEPLKKVAPDKVTY
jgi:NitT/TauT family transport system substrate-binding protein